jgi:hypothetical protein
LSYGGGGFAMVNYLYGQQKPAEAGFSAFGKPCSD